MVAHLPLPKKELLMAYHRPASRSGRTALRVIAGLAVLLALVVLFLPLLVSSTTIFQNAMGRELSKQHLKLEIGQRRIGWFRTLQLDDIEMSDDRGLFHLRAKQLTGDRTLGQWLWSRSELGAFVLDSPVLTLDLEKLPPPGTAPAAPPTGASESGKSAPPGLRFELRNGTILVRSPGATELETLVDQCNVQVELAHHEGRGTLTILPGKPLQRVNLTPALCDVGLKFVAPIVADVAWTRGEVSLELDQCQIPLDAPAAAAVQGRVTLHAVEAGLKDPLSQQLVQMIANVVKKQPPEAVRLADQSVIEFLVQDQKVQHSGLAFGFPELSPDLVVRTQGTVGFDKSLDLLAEIPLPTKLLGDRPLAQVLGDKPLSLPITGTLDAWKVGAGEGQLAEQLLGKLLESESLQNLSTEDVLQALQQMRQRSQERRETAGPLLERLRGRRSSNR
jgi:hypothetical protein